MSDILSSIGRAFNGIIPNTGNQFLDGMLITGLLSILTLMLRSIPRKIGALIIRYFSTEMMLTSAQISFHDFMKWLDKNGHSTKIRRIQIRNGRWGHDDKATKGVGNGQHVIWHPLRGSIFKRRPFVLNLEKIDQSFTDVEKERLTIRVLGRSHAPLDNLLEDCKKAAITYEGTCIRKYGEYWMDLGNVPNRSMDSIVLPESKKQLLLDRINKFLSSEQWCIQHGIPWHLGIMLYGPPGTGKSSLVRAIADYLGRNINILPAHRLYWVDTALATAEAKCIVAIEDIDTSWTVQAREELLKQLREADKAAHSKEGAPNTVGPAGASDSPGKVLMPGGFNYVDRSSDLIEDLQSSSGLSVVLNVLDGLEATHGRVIIMTANSIDSIDPALMRPGRIDLCLEIGNLDDECFRGMLHRFFPGKAFPSDDYHVEANLMPAKVQEEVVRGMTFDEILEKHRA
ncbi:MAG: AAA family ATPase [Dehalococcoidia bacterium]|jgi:chaperone BCS1